MHDTTGVEIAQAALIRTQPEPGESPTLADLTQRLDHIKSTQEGWRSAVAFLAAQLHAERRNSDAARGRDAIFALSMIADQMKWWQEREDGRNG